MRMCWGRGAGIVRGFVMAIAMFVDGANAEMPVHPQEGKTLPQQYPETPQQYPEPSQQYPGAPQPQQYQETPQQYPETPQQYPGTPQQYPATPPQYPATSFPPPSSFPAPPPAGSSLPYQLPPSSLPPLPFATTPSPTGQAGCDVALSADRTTVALVDRASGEDFQHVGLGQDRVQKIYTAPDATWSVATAKVRREQRFYFIAVDLAKCEPQEAVAITGPAQEATFAGSEVVLKIGGNEQRFALRNK